MTPTPGPWRLHSDGLSVFGAGPDSQQVADLGVCSPNIRRNEQFANARLIAAAPELLVALTAAAHALHSYAYGNAARELAQEVATLADDALAQAEGRVRVGTRFSGQPCGCDPAAGWTCEQHRDPAVTS